MIVDPVTLVGSSRPGALPPGFRPVAADALPPTDQALAPPDARILWLVEEYWRRHRIELATGEEDDRLRLVFKLQRPVPPPEIRHDAIRQYAKLTPSFFRPDETEAGSHISRQGADWLRANPRTREVMVTWKDGAHTFERAKDEVAEARVQAMLVVYDRWLSECLEVAERVGAVQAQAAYEAAEDSVWEVLHELYNAWPTTLLGFAALASVMVDRNHTEDAFYVLAQRLAVQAAHIRPADIESGLASIEIGPGVSPEPVREVA